MTTKNPYARYELYPQPKPKSRQQQEPSNSSRSSSKPNNKTNSFLPQISNKSDSDLKRRLKDFEGKVALIESTNQSILQQILKTQSELKQSSKQHDHSLQHETKARKVLEGQMKSSLESASHSQHQASQQLMALMSEVRLEREKVLYEGEAARRNEIELISDLETKVNALVYSKNQTELALEDLRTNFMKTFEHKYELLSEECKFECLENKKHIGRLELQQNLMKDDIVRVGDRQKVDVNALKHLQHRNQQKIDEVVLMMQRVAPVEQNIENKTSARLTDIESKWEKKIQELTKKQKEDLH